MNHIKYCIFLLLPISVVSCSLSAGKRLDVASSENTILKSGKDPQPYRLIKLQKTHYPDYRQLVKLSSNPEANAEEIEHIWKQALIDNSYYYKAGIPKFQSSKPLGPLLRVATWNIQKSLNVPQIVAALQSEKAYLKTLKSDLSLKEKRKALAQRKRLRTADVLILQEVDIGHCRSGYRNNAEYLAKKLGMNYAYGVNQLEISPEYLSVEGNQVHACKYGCEFCSTTLESRKDYKGLFGVAVLSKFPIKRVRLKQLDTQVYNWYDQEVESPDILEKSRRGALSLLFKHGYTRELKIGGRSFMQVDLHVPGLPQESLSVVNTHLEIKASPKQRRAQIQEILRYIKPIKNPVILAGDFNSAPIDASPTSVPRAVEKVGTSPRALASIGLSFANVPGVSQAKTFFNYYKNYRNPLASHTAVVFPNPQHSMFRMIRDFRFEDGGAFDFRGEKQSTLGKVGVLSNSNQRKGKGFEFTFSVPRPIGPFGHEKLDWFFVKSFLTESNEKNGSKRLAPHFGETLNAFNRGRYDIFSDHSPMVIDLPVY